MSHYEYMYEYLTPLVPHAHAALHCYSVCYGLPLKSESFRQTKFAVQTFRLGIPRQSQTRISLKLSDSRPGDLGQADGGADERQGNGGGQGHADQGAGKGDVGSGGRVLGWGFRGIVGRSLAKGVIRQLGLRRESTLANSIALCAPSAHLCV